MQVQLSSTIYQFQQVATIEDLSATENYILTTSETTEAYLLAFSNIIEDHFSGGDDYLGPISAYFGYSVYSLTHADITPVDVNYTMTFIGTDGAAPDTTLWTVNTNYSVAGTVEIQSNKLQLEVPNTANDEYVFAESKFKVSGDFDFQIDYDEVSNDAPSTSQSYPARLQIVFENTEYFYINTRLHSDSSRRTHLNGTNTSSTVITECITTGKFRITRVGSIIKAYYWDSQWEWDGNTAGFTTGETDLTDVSIIIHTHADFDSGAVTDFDNLIINSGTIVWP